VVPRRPGQFLRERVRLYLGLFVVGWTISLALVIAGFRWWPLALTGVLLLMALRVLFDGRRRFDAEPWLTGLRGEVAVGRILAPLEAEGYRVLHDLEATRGNVDHVVIGPTGVFAVETKALKGSLFPRKGGLVRNGYPADNLVDQAIRGAMEVRRRLAGAGMSIWVDAVLVSTRAKVRGSPLRFRQALVIEADALAGHIRSGRPKLDAANVARATAAILRDSAPVARGSR
jgi:hypothetical protein